MQQKISLNGEPLRDVTYAVASIDASAPPADSFVVSDSARAQYAAASKINFSRLRVGMRGPSTELGAGIVRVPDFWAQTLVKQDDGVVLFEAHISAQYLHDVIGEAQKRWPGAPIKALVMTSDPWAHLGGVREAMALGIPIYINANSIPFLKRLTASPHHLAPDSLARSRLTPKLIGVIGKTTIGKGTNRIELYPIGGPYAERMLMAYFPARRLVYGADLVFPNRGADGKPAPGFFETEATDLRNAVERERLDVDSVFCVQNYPAFAWSDVAASARRSAPPTLTPGDKWLQPVAFHDPTEHRRTLYRNVTGDTTEHEAGRTTVSVERVPPAGSHSNVVRILTLGQYANTANNFVDTLELDALTLAPLRERLRYPIRPSEKFIQYHGDRLTQRNQLGDSTREFERRFPVNAFAFQEIDYFVRSLPQRVGFTAALPLYSEGDDSLETDTVSVTGHPSADRWTVRFADAVIIATYTLDASRNIVAYEVAGRRNANVRVRRVTEP